MSLEQHLQQLADRIGSRVREAVAADLASALSPVLSEVREEAAEAARREARQAHEDELRLVREEHEAQLQTIREAEASAADQLRAAHDVALREFRDSADAERAAAAADRDAVLADRDAALARRDAAVSDRDTVAAERDAALADRDAAISDRDTAVTARDAFAAERDAAVAERDAARTEARSALAAVPGAASAEALTDAHVEERQADLACTDRLLDFVRHANGAATLSQVLDELTDFAAGEAGRAVLFVAQGSRLRLWRTCETDATVPLQEGFSIPSDEAGVLGEAFRTAHPVARLGGSEDREWPSGLAAIGLDSGAVGLALPVVVSGSAVAVLYVDEGGAKRPMPSGWPELLEVATRHAGRCLDVLTAQRAASLRHAQPPGGTDAAESIATSRPGPDQPAEVDEEAARRHARLLISEIRLYHETAVMDGRRASDLRSRLASEIERARRLYEARIPDSLASRSRVFEDELVRTLADGEPDLMG